MNSEGPRGNEKPVHLFAPTIQIISGILNMVKISEFVNIELI